MKRAEPEHDATHGRARGGRRGLTLLACLVLGWLLLMRRFGSTDPYAVMGPYALSVTAAAFLLRSAALRRWLAPSVRLVLLGLSLGTGMALLTYPAFRLAVQLVPPLQDQVRGLYAAARTGSLAQAMAWTAVIVLAEELLWRGVLLDALEHRMQPQLAAALCVLSYALAQLGSGSWIVFALALLCGALWTVARKWSQSLVPSLISHLIWTESVILLRPVT